MDALCHNAIFIVLLLVLFPILSLSVNKLNFPSSLDPAQLNQDETCIVDSGMLLLECRGKTNIILVCNRDGEYFSEAWLYSSTAECLYCSAFKLDGVVPEDTGLYRCVYQDNIDTYITAMVFLHDSEAFVAVVNADENAFIGIKLALRCLPTLPNISLRLEKEKTDVTDCFTGEPIFGFIKDVSIVFNWAIPNNITINNIKKRIFSAPEKCWDSVIYIKHQTLEDSETYKCSVNGNLVISEQPGSKTITAIDLCSINVYVQLVNTQESGNLIEGRDFTLRGGINTFPPIPLLIYQHKNKNISHDLKHLNVQCIHYIMFINLKHDDFGNYSLEIQTEEGNQSYYTACQTFKMVTKSTSIFVRIRSHPFINSLSAPNAVVIEGKLVKVKSTCTMIAYSELAINWTFELDRQYYIDNGENKIVKALGNMWDATFISKSNISTNLCCEASNNFGNVSKNILVNTTEEEAVEFNGSINLEHVEVRWNDDLLVNCFVIGPHKTNMYSLYWYKNGILINTTDLEKKYGQSNTEHPHQLKLVSINRMNGETYKCVGNDTKNITHQPVPFKYIVSIEFFFAWKAGYVTVLVISLVFILMLTVILSLLFNHLNHLCCRLVQYKGDGYTTRQLGVNEQVNIVIIPHLLQQKEPQDQQTVSGNGQQEPKDNEDGEKTDEVEGPLLIKNSRSGGISGGTNGSGDGSGQAETDINRQRAGVEDSRLENEPQSDKSSVVLDWYNSDISLKIDQETFLSATPMTQHGFVYVWHGVKATYGFFQGRVYYEVKIEEEVPVPHLKTKEKHPHLLHVGWSIDETGMMLGKEKLSYGYSGIGKASVNLKIKNYGGPFGKGDIVGCYLDTVSEPKTIFYTINGQYKGICYTINCSELGNKALYPHIATKNCSFKVNFGSDDPWAKPLIGYTFIGDVPIEDRVMATQGPEKRSDCEIIMMVGLPASGKTTWVNNFCCDNPDKKYNILGTDTLIDKIMINDLPHKRNYSECWKFLSKPCTKCFNILLQMSYKRRRNFIIDQTNVYPSARKRKMKGFVGFKRRAVVICTTDEDLKKRSEKRVKEEGKYISDKAVLEMKANFKLPEVGNLFDVVEFIGKSRENAEKLLEKYNKKIINAHFRQKNKKCK